MGGALEELGVAEVGQQAWLRGLWCEEGRVEAVEEMQAGDAVWAAEAPELLAASARGREGRRLVRLARMGALRDVRAWLEETEGVGRGGRGPGRGGARARARRLAQDAVLREVCEAEVLARLEGQEGIARGLEVLRERAAESAREEEISEDSGSDVEAVLPDAPSGGALREFGQLPVALPPYWCRLCDADFASEEAFGVHKAAAHGGEVIYRLRVLWKVEERGDAPVSGPEARAHVEAFAESMVTGSRGWAAGARGPPRGVERTRDAERGAAWKRVAGREAPRRLGACVGCAGLAWERELTFVPLVGEGAGVARLDEFVALLAPERYVERCRANGVERGLAEVERACVRLRTGARVVLHKRRFVTPRGGGVACESALEWSAELRIARGASGSSSRFSYQSPPIGVACLVVYQFLRSEPSSCGRSSVLAVETQSWSELSGDSSSTNQIQKATRAVRVKTRWSRRL